MLGTSCRPTPVARRWRVERAQVVLSPREAVNKRPVQTAPVQYNSGCRSNRQPVQIAGGQCKAALSGTSATTGFDMDPKVSMAIHSIRVGRRKVSFPPRFPTGRARPNADGACANGRPLAWRVDHRVRSVWSSLLTSALCCAWSWLSAACSVLTNKDPGPLNSCATPPPTPHPSASAREPAAGLGREVSQCCHGFGHLARAVPHVMPDQCGGGGGEEREGGREREGCNKKPDKTQRNKGRKTGIRSNARRETRTDQQNGRGRGRGRGRTRCHCKGKCGPRSQRTTWRRKRKVRVRVY